MRRGPLGECDRTVRRCQRGLTDRRTRSLLPPLSVGLALCLATLLASSSCGGGEPKEQQQPTAVLSGGTGEIISPSFDIPADGWSIGIQFQQTGSDWDASANWRVTVYSDQTGEAVAYVDRRVTPEADTTEAWAARNAPGTSALPAAGTGTASSAGFGTGAGAFHVGISVTGVDQWSAAIFLSPPGVAPN